MVVDILFGFRCSRACELIGLDFWEHQFDDGSIDSNRDKAKLFDLAQIRQDLSRRNRHIDSVVPKKWRSPKKKYEQKYNASSSSELFDEPAPAVASMTSMDDEVEKLNKKVEDLERKIGLLTLGMLRSQTDGTTDICATRTRADSSPVGPEKSDL